ncbi:MAG: glycosyltransferase family 4 protein [Candidatus Peribacteraceae bacterium]|nr:glycosyltransferase family 4 protein [Candidatus Peribacteraceae bacterium]MBP9850377.1 glycosyltransferase family 4 protein [Candidatus Peribacteraceae bacterium]
MRVLLTCEDYFPHLGGAEVCVFNVRQELKAKGHTVTVFTNTLATSNDEDRVIRLKWSFSPGPLFRTFRVLWKTIGEQDIVHCTYSFRIACICAMICRIRRVPMLLTQQGRGIVPEANPKLLHRVLFRACQEISMRLATHITSTSDEITDLTAAFVPRSKITLVSNGYDADLFTPNPSIPVPPEFKALSPDITTLLTIRRLVPKNGIHILVQALALVLKERQDFHYFAIGEGRTETFIRELISKHNLERNITLLGKRGNDQLLPFYQHADLLLVPSSAEARSIACIEAMGMAKPIIASRVGGLIDLLGPDSTYGDLVAIYDSEACTYDPPDTLPPERLQRLADAILAFLKDPTPLTKKGEAARYLVSVEYSWKSITQKYVGLYMHMLQR